MRGVKVTPGLPGENMPDLITCGTLFSVVTQNLSKTDHGNGNSPIFLSSLVIQRDHPVDPAEPGKRPVTRIVGCRVAFKDDLRSHAVTSP